MKIEQFAPEEQITRKNVNRRVEAMAEGLAQARAITRRLPVAEGYSVKAGDVVDVNAIDPGGLPTFGDLAVGSTVKVDEGGKLVDYIVVQQGKPSEMYDESCNGTWLLRSKLWKAGAFDAGNLSDYAPSDANQRLQGEYVPSLGEKVQAAMKTFKVPYVDGPGTTGTVKSGGNGLEVRAALLSPRELNQTDSTAPEDGRTLAYFTGVQEEDPKLIAYRDDGVAGGWWTRSPEIGTQYDSQVWRVTNDGNVQSWSADVSSSHYILPFIIVDSSWYTTFDRPSEKVDMAVKNIEPQANVERVFDSNTGTRAVDLIRLSDKYCIAADISSAGHQIKCFLLNAETGERISEESAASGSNNTITGVSLARLDDSRFVVGYVGETGTQTKIGTIDGTSILFSGSSGNFANPTGDTSVELENNLAARIHCNSSGLTIRTVSASSNNTPVWGAQGTLSAFTSASGLSATRIPDDESGNKRVCVCFSDGADGNKGKAVIATIDSANQVTWGEVVTWMEPSVAGATSCCFDGEYVIAAACRDTTIRALSIDPALSVAGEPYSVAPATADRVPIINIGGAVVLTYYDGRTTIANRGARACVIKNSSGILSSETAYVFNKDNQARYAASSAISDIRFMVAYADYGDSSRSTCTILTVEDDQIAGDFLDKSSQAIALQDGNVGDLIDIIYSGTAELPMAQGTKIESPGVQGYAPLEGLLEVFPWYMPGVKIATGSYVGTGTSGSGNKTKIVFSSKPLLVFVDQINAGDGGVPMMNPVTHGYVLSGSGLDYPINLIWGDTSLEMWASSAGTQMNAKGVTYTYVALLA